MKIKKLEPLLEYQRADIERLKLERLIENSETAKKMKKAKLDFNTAREELKTGEKQAEKAVAFYEKSLSFYDDINKEIDKLVKSYEKLQDSDVEECKKILKSLEEYKARLSDLEQKIVEQRKKIEQVIKISATAQEKGLKAREVYSRQKDEYEQFKASKSDEMQKLEKTLATLKKGVDAVDLELYETVTGEKKYPAVVPITTTDDGKIINCGGCGLALSVKAHDEITDDGSGKCENCRRIIYKKPEVIAEKKTTKKAK